MPEPTHLPRKIFISYRHGQHDDFVERIWDHLAGRFGHDNVFMDFGSIPLFSSFPDSIRQKILDCDALVAIIDSTWVEVLKERLDSGKTDWVRTEISLALHEGKVIAPICIKGAQPPEPDALPDDMRRMHDFQAAVLNSGRHFLDNIQPIMDAIERQIQYQIEARKVVAPDIQARVNVIEMIQRFEAAEDRGDMESAFEWLHQIKLSGQMPSFYPVDEYIERVQVERERQRAEKDYQLIRMLAERAERGREGRDRVWKAIQEFWTKFQGYDPDELASRFRPEPVPKLDIHQPILGSVTITPSPAIMTASASIGGVGISEKSLDQSLADGSFFESLNKTDESQFLLLENASESIELSDAKQIPLDQARTLGLLDNL